jgi:hypothetical protein
LLAGTTTVVDLSGGGGLLLLMQPDREATINSDAKTIFMRGPSFCVWTRLRQPNFDHV